MVAVNGPLRVIDVAPLRAVHLNEVLEWLDYGKSELYSGMENLPDYRANESSRDSLSQAESYLVDVEDMLVKIIKELDVEEDEDTDDK